jgi:hypothetical protein
MQISYELQGLLGGPRLGSARLELEISRTRGAFPLKPALTEQYRYSARVYMRVIKGGLSQTALPVQGASRSPQDRRRRRASSLRSPMEIGLPAIFAHKPGDFPTIGVTGRTIRRPSSRPSTRSPTCTSLFATPRAAYSIWHAILSYLCTRALLKVASTWGAAGGGPGRSSCRHLVAAVLAVLQGERFRVLKVHLRHIRYTFATCGGRAVGPDSTSLAILGPIWARRLRTGGPPFDLPLCPDHLRAASAFYHPSHRCNSSSRMRA